MKAGRSVRLKRLAPHARALQSCLLQFAKKGDGIVVSHNFSSLALAKSLVANTSAEEKMEWISRGEALKKAAGLLGTPLPKFPEAKLLQAAVGKAREVLEPDFRLGRSWATPGMQEEFLNTLHLMWAHDASFIDDRLFEAKLEPALTEKLSALRAIEGFATGLCQSFGRTLPLDLTRGLADLEPAAGTTLGRWLFWLGDEPLISDLALASALNKFGAEVWVAVEFSPAHPELFDFQSLVGLNVDGETIGEDNRLAPALFRREPVDPDLAVGLATAPDVLTEAEWVAEQCLRLVHEGTEPDQIAVYLADPGMAVLLQTAGERAGIRFSQSRRLPLLSNRFAHFLLQLLKAAVGSDVRLLLGPFRQVYAQFESIHLAQFKQALVDANKLGGNQWKALGEWAEQNLEVAPWLRPFLDWRDDASAVASKPTEWYGKLRDLTELIPWQEGCTPVGDALIDRDVRALTALQSSFSAECTVEKIYGSQSWTLPQAVAVMERAWAAADVSVPRQDGIAVCTRSADLGCVDYVFGVGFAEGVVPSRRRQSPVLSDDERDAVSRALSLVQRLPTSTDFAIAERREFVRLCTAPLKSLTLSYSSTQGEDRRQASPYFLQVDELVAGAKRIVIPRFLDSLEESLADANQALATAMKARIGSAPPVELTAKADWTDEWPTPDRMTPFAVGRALDCPFQFFGDDVLKARSSDIKRVWQRMYRLPLFARLALAPDKETATKEMSSRLDELVESQRGLVADHELALLQAKGRRLIERWVDREFEARPIFRKGAGPVTAPFDLESNAAPIRKTQLIGSLDGAYFNGEQHFGIFYLPTDFFSGVVDSAGEFTQTRGRIAYVGLMAAALYGREKAPFAFEIDDAEGDSRSVYVSNLADFSPSGLNSRFRRRSMGEQSVRARLEAGVQGVVIARGVIESKTVRPNPGKPCEQCEFGELCRYSSQFSEGHTDVEQPGEPQVEGRRGSEAP